MHVVTQVSEQVFCFSKTRLLILYLSSSEKEVFPLFVFNDYWAAIFLQFFFDCVLMAIAFLQLVHEGAVD
jgi:hypothetical protein